MQGRIIAHHKYSDRRAVRPGMQAHAEDCPQRTLGERFLVDACVSHDLIRLHCPSNARVNYAEQQAYKQSGATNIFSNCHDLFYSFVIHMAALRLG